MGRREREVGTNGFFSPAPPWPVAAAAVMAAVLSPRVCDSDPATPGAQSLKVRRRQGGLEGTKGAVEVFVFAPTHA